MGELYLYVKLLAITSIAFPNICDLRIAEVDENFFFMVGTDL